MRLQLGDNVCICNHISASPTTSGNRPSETLGRLYERTAREFDIRPLRGRDGPDRLRLVLEERRASFTWVPPFADLERTPLTLKTRPNLSPVGGV